MNGLDSQFLTIFTFERFNIWTFLETSEHLKHHDPLNTDPHRTRLKLSNYFDFPWHCPWSVTLINSQCAFLQISFPHEFFLSPWNFKCHGKSLVSPPFSFVSLTQLGVGGKEGLKLTICDVSCWFNLIENSQQQYDWWRLHTKYKYDFSLSLSFR